jgi:hypothetical protein
VVCVGGVCGGGGGVVQKFVNFIKRKRNLWVNAPVGPKYVSHKEVLSSPKGQFFARAHLSCSNFRKRRTTLNSTVGLAV